MIIASHQYPSQPDTAIKNGGGGKGVEGGRGVGDPLRPEESYWVVDATMMAHRWDMDISALSQNFDYFISRARLFRPFSLTTVYIYRLNSTFIWKCRLSL